MTLKPPIDFETDLNTLQSSGAIFDVTEYGAVGDGRVVTDAAITSGTATLTSSQAAFTNRDRGKTIAIKGAGTQLSAAFVVGDILLTTISSVSGGVATLATNAGFTVTNATATFGFDQTSNVAAAILDAGVDGGEVFFPPGRYFFTGSSTTHFSVPSNVTLRGVRGASILDFSGRTTWTSGSDNAFIVGLGTIGSNNTLTKDAKKLPDLPIDCTSITSAAGVATVTTKSAHGMATGDWFFIRGGGGSVTPGDEGYYTEANNGVQTDPVVVTGSGSATTLTYAMAGRAKPATGVASTDVITVIGHGYVVDTPLVFSGLTGGTGLSNGTTYYARTITTNTFQVAAAPAGAAINFTTDITAPTLVTATPNATLTGVAHVIPFGPLVVIASTSGFRADDQVVVSSDAFRVDEGSETIDLGEPNIVERVINSTVLKLKKPVRDNYLVSDAAKIQKVTPCKNMHLKDLIFNGKGTNISATVSADKGIRFDYFQSVSVQGCEFTDIDTVVCEFRMGLDWEFANNKILFDQYNVSGRVSGHAYVQYGCSFANGAEDGTVTGNEFYNGRHQVVQASGSARPGISRNISITGNFHSGSWLGAISTHQGYDNGIISGNVFDGCNLAITVRYAEGTEITENVIYGSEGAIQVAKHWNGVHIKNNNIRNCWTGITLATQINPAQSTGELDITGNVIQNTESAIELNATQSGTVMQGIRVDMNRIKNTSYTPISIVAGAGAGKSVTGVAATDIFTSVAHGFSNGDIVIFSSMTGGTGLITGDTYFVINKATDTFQVSTTPSGSAFDFTTNLSAGTVCKDYFTGSVSGNTITNCGQVLAANAIRLTNARYVELRGNRIESWTGLSRGMLVDGTGTVGCVESDSVILGATTANIDITTGVGHQQENRLKESLTIASGAIAPRLLSRKGPNVIQIDTEAAAATDDLDVITTNANLPDGTIIILRSGTSARDPSIRDLGVSGGNIQTVGGVAFTLATTRDHIMLLWDKAAAEWHELLRVTI